MRPFEAGARGKGTRGVSVRGPSRPRPWQAVAVAETAGDVRRDGDGPRERHGFVTGEGRIRRVSAPPWGGTPAAERSGICAVPYFGIAEVSNTARTPWFEIHLWRALRTAEIPNRSNLPLSPTNPSHPGRLMEVTACQDLH